MMWVHESLPEGALLICRRLQSEPINSLNMAVDDYLLTVSYICLGRHRFSMWLVHSEI